MLATGATLGCGLSICLAVFPTEAQAAEAPRAAAAVYRFDDWEMVVQPGTAPVTTPFTGIVVEPKPGNSSRIELASYQVPPAPMPAFPPVEKPVDGALVTPAETSIVVTPKPAETEPCPPLSSEGMVRVQSYRAVYDSIPFSRAEYEANPSYRHDATMEFLFNQMRPTVIQRQQRTRVDINMPAPRQTLPWYNWYGIHNQWSPYSYPPYRW